MVSIWGSSPAQRSFDLLGLLCRLGDLTTGGGFLFHTFYHSYCDGLTHVTHRKPSWRGAMGKKTQVIADLMRTNDNFNWVKVQIANWRLTQKQKSCHRAVNLPSGGYSEKLSTHMGLPGIMSTMAASPDFRNLGLSSSFFPERRSIFSLSSANLQAMCAVWQSNTGA